MTGYHMNTTNCWPQTTPFPQTTGIGYTTPISAGPDIYEIREKALSFALGFVNGSYRSRDVIAIAAAFENYLLKGFENGKTTEVSKEGDTGSRADIAGE